MSIALVVEDNDNNMVLISRILQNAGHRVIQAETGKQGLLLAKEHSPDFIILDIQLPDILGSEVVQLLRKDGVTVPVIAMTSYAMAGDKEKLLALGCDGYVEKPIDPLLVVSQIEAVIQS